MVKVIEIEYAKPGTYSNLEMIAVAGAHALEDRKTVFVGTGLPIISSTLAQLTHAPNLIPIFEAGSIGPILDAGLPLSVGDSRASNRPCLLGGLCTAFELAQRGAVDYGFIGGAQIDMYGNVNSTMLGRFPEDYRHPKVRFPGSGGAGAMACCCEKTIVIMVHERRRFVERLDYLTSPGYFDGSNDARWNAGWPGSGPVIVITNLALLDFDEKTRRMRLKSIHPGVTIDQVIEATGFELIIPDDIQETEPPTTEELELLREKIDPEGYFLKKQVKE